MESIISRNSDEHVVNKGKEINQGRNFRKGVNSEADIAGEKDLGTENSNFKAANPNVNIPIGPEDEKLDGPNLEERKRRKSGPTTFENMDTAGGLIIDGRSSKDIPNIDSVLSNTDCADSSSIFLAKFASKSSQSQ